jgi:hypothetical protein
MHGRPARMERKVVIISVINHTKLSDATVHDAIRAINRQISEDFEPYWSLGANPISAALSARRANPSGAKGGEGVIMKKGNGFASCETRFIQS